MDAFYCDDFALPLPPGHRFPMQKYVLLRERAVAEGVLDSASLHVPAPAARAALLRVHTAGYVARVWSGDLTPEEVRRIGFPWSRQLVERALRSVGATIAACRAALRAGVAANLAGGTHHAFADRGEGFCVFNDAAVAARACQAEGLARRIAILDFDVHQGNGTAAIFARDPSVFTASVHGAANFPFHKERGDLDIALPDGTGDDAYLAAVRRALFAALERARPELLIYVSGADPFEGDRLGRLAVSKRALAERDAIVFEACRAAGAAVAVTMAGGYGRRVQDTVDIHLATLRAASAMPNSTTPRSSVPKPVPQ